MNKGLVSVEDYAGKLCVAPQIMTPI